MLNCLRVAACLLLAGCTIYAPPPVPYQAKLTDRTDLTYATQIQLIRLGYIHGPVAGLYDDGPRDAICAFQDANGVLPDGLATPTLLTVLQASTPVVRPPSVARATGA